MEILGILNVTPDSFSDGGQWHSAEDAIARAGQLIEDGATIIDVGGESTRPGATPITSDEEWARISPVIAALVAEGIAVSVDTYHAKTARRAISAGASIINDVTGGRVEPAIYDVLAAADADYVLQHSRGGSVTTDEAAVYTDIIDDIAREMSESIAKAEAAGIDRKSVV